MESVREEYPKEILPRVTFKHKLNVDKLLEKFPMLMAVRQVSGDINQFIIKTEKGQEEISEKIFTNNMANLSMNLGGGLFDVSSKGHLRFLPAQSVVRPWNGEEIDVNICSEEESYTVCEICYGLCMYIKDIHKRTFPFFKHFDTQQARDSYEQEVKSTTDNISSDAKYVGAFKSKRDNVEVRPRIMVHHSPTNANYWHITLDTYRPTDMEYVSPTEHQNGSDKKMFKALKQDLVQCCMIDALPAYKIDRQDYDDIISEDSLNP